MRSPRLASALLVSVVAWAAAGASAQDAPEDADRDADLSDAEWAAGGDRDDEEAEGEDAERAEGEAAAGEAGADADAGVAAGEGDDAEGDDGDDGDAEGPAGDDPAANGDLYEPVQDPDAAIGLPETLCEGRPIRRIRIEGVRRVHEDDVLATIRLRTGRTCRDALVARDARALWDQGLIDDIREEANRVAGGRVDLEIRVRERPAIGRITFEGNDNIEDATLEEEVDLTVNGILSVPRVRRQVTAIRDKYAEEGYFLVRVSHELRPMSNNRVEVAFRVTEGRQVTVRRVRFVGNRHVSSDTLQGFMRTRGTRWFSFITNDDRFNREFFEEDTVRLQAYYYDQGYLAMRVGTPRVELSPDRGSIEITVPVVEGPRFRIGRLQVREVDEGGREIEPLGGRRAIRSMVQSNPGEWFNRTRIAQSLLQITRRYRDAGYANVDIVPETALDDVRRTVDIRIVIRRGPPVTVARINIRGNTKTRDGVIRREMFIREGDLYSQSQVERSRLMIQALGYFERVEFSEERGTAPDEIVITVEVAERPTGQFQIGAGFSSLESFILTGQVNQQNLFGNGHSLSLNLQLSGIQQRGQLSFFEPWLLGTQWDFGFSVFRTRRQFSFFSRDSTGGSVTFGHPIVDRRLTFLVQYQADFVDIGAATGGLFGSGSLAQGLNLFVQAPFDNLFRDGLTSSLRLILTWDGRDNRLFPTDGFYASWSTEWADEIIGSQNTFLRHNLDVRGYVPLFVEGLTLRMRGVWGLITSRFAQGVPLYERFFLGGIFNVRGFPLNRLGPRLGVADTVDPNRDVFPPGISIGGNMQFFYNVEIEFPIVTEVGIRGVVFTDGGNAWNLNDTFCNAPVASAGIAETDACRVNLFDLRYSVGFGIRWVSPLGPLRFEWGIPFNRQPDLLENTVDFQFTIGNFF
ncbi:MAG: outer membrane protein assembly factor BamA [Sandaracinaceae bacterium]